MLYFQHFIPNSGNNNWHVVRSAVDYDDRPLVRTVGLKPPKKPKPSSKQFPLGTVFIHFPAELQSKFMLELNARFIFFEQDRTPEIALRYNGKVYLAIEPRKKFYIVPMEDVPYLADVWAFDNEENIPDMLKALWDNYFSRVPLQIRIDTYSQFTPSGFNIYANRIEFFNGKYSTEILFETIEYLANLYDNLLLSEDKKVAIKTMSKQTIYFRDEAVGALLLEDVMMIAYLYKVLQMEALQLVNNRIPNYAELHQNLANYIVKWQNILPKRLNDLMINFDNQFINKEVSNREFEKKIINVEKPDPIPIFDSCIYMDEDGNIIEPGDVDTTPVQI